MGRNTGHAIIQTCLKKTNRIQQNGEHIVQNEEFDFKDADF